jgi:hypothetical protein
MPEGTVSEVKNKPVAELLGVIADYGDPEVIEQTAKWAFTNNKELFALPAFINSLVEIDFETDLKITLDALNEDHADWLNDLPKEDSTAIMEALVNCLNDKNPDEETKKVIVNVLAMLPQKAVDVLNVKMGNGDNGGMIEIIKKIIDEIANP